MAYNAPMWDALRTFPIVTQLRVVRALCGLTQIEFANALALSARTYSGYETGTRPVPYRERQRLSARLGELVTAETSLNLARRLRAVAVE
jgi:transcriptional regulator with XRE-family HTH domain